MAQEKAFEEKIKKHIEMIGGWQVKYFANRMTKKGIPDILACISGHFIAIEVKAQNGRSSELQVYQCNKIRMSGGLAHIVYPSGWEQLKVILNMLKHDVYDITLPLILR